MGSFIMLVKCIAIIGLTIFLFVMCNKMFRIIYIGKGAVLGFMGTCFLISVVIVSVVFRDFTPIKSNASAIEKEYIENYIEEEKNAKNENSNLNEDSDKDNISDENQDNEYSVEDKDTEYNEEMENDAYSDNEYVEENEVIEEISETEYIIENSDTEYINKSDINNLTKEKLRLARNEIYARHGCIFKSDDLNKYFNSTSWYVPTIEVADFDTSQFNQYELANINTIKSLE